MSVGLMAKKRAKVEKPSPEPAPAVGRDELVSFRCKPAFKEHLERIADSETRTPTQVIERALRAYAETSGHEPFPAR